MTTVFDFDNLPDRRLTVRKIVALSSHMNIGEAIHYVKRDLRMMLADAMLDKDKPFFWEKGSVIAWQSYVEYGVDCVIMTREEFIASQREAFKRGIEHATGVVRMPL